MADPFSILGDLGSFITPKTVLGGLGLGTAALMGNKQPTGYQQFSNIATPLAAQGQAMMQQGVSGQVTPGGQAALDTAAASAKANTKQTYANLGLAGSSMEADAMRGIDQQLAAQKYQMSQSLIKEGLAATGLSAGLFEQIMKINTAQDAEFLKAINQFALGFAGGTRE